MSFPRERSRIPPTGRVSVRLTTSQRDVLIESGAPKDLGHVLHRAPVRNGKLMIQVTRDELDSLVAAAARSHPEDRQAERETDALLRYLESLEDRFAAGGEDEADAPA